MCRVSSECLPQREGFTLVELAIVIVIIGFLVAGIAVGANMIRQAELRSVITDLRLHQVAYNNFIGRYNKVPGDMDTASSFWTATSGVTSCAATITNCNGDGDGLIEHGTAIGTNEHLKAWKHLSLSGMVAANVIQLNPSNDGSLTVGTEAPNSKRSGVGYVFSAGGALVDSTLNVTSRFATSTNAVYAGRGGTVRSLLRGSFTPDEAFSLDQKLDDGIVSAGAFSGAATGAFRSVDATDAAATGDCATGAGATNYTIATTYSACVIGLAVN